MNKKTIPLSNLMYKQKARIITLDGGNEFQRKLRIMGIREGQLIRIISKQPLRGPLTVAINGCQMTLGRGMANKIIVDII
jgi:ferrous iron transport protein A